MIKKQGSQIETVQNKTNRILLFLLILCSSLYSCAQQKKINTGIYENGLNIGYDSISGEISGFIDFNPYEEVKDAVQIGCKFFFKSENISKRKEINITIYNLVDNIDTISGTLQIETDKIYLKFRRNIPSCMSVIYFNENNEVSFDLEKKNKFNAFGFVLIDKLFFYKTPFDNDRTQKYILKNDIFEILKIKNGWLLIRFRSGKVTEGWVKESEVKI
jgi:hypothetical protein